jgi:hypothetical protein
MRGRGLWNIYQHYLNDGNLRCPGLGFNHFERYGDGNLCGPTSSEQFGHVPRHAAAEHHHH